MRFLFLCFCIAILFSCKKKNDNATPSYTYEQAWDSVGIQYEQRYTCELVGKEPDTIIFHANKTITLFNHHFYSPVDTFHSITFPVSSSNTTIKTGYYPYHAAEIVFYPVAGAATGYAVRDKFINDTAIIIQDVSTWTMQFSNRAISKVYTEFLLSPIK